MRPSLLLDFAKTKMLDTRITFTRNSKAGYFDRNGVYQMAAAGEPRFDHDPATGICKGLLIEEQRTNLLTYSEQFDNAAWPKLSGANVTPTASLAPDGLSVFYRMTTNGLGSSVYQEKVVTTDIYVGSVFFKTTSTSQTARLVGFFLGSATEFAGEVRFNPSTGQFISASDNTKYMITNCGNGVFRVSYVFTRTNPLNTYLRMQVFVVENADKYLDLWGAQLEQGAFPTSYIPTEAALVTRNADIALIANNNFSSFYRQDEGSLYISAMQYSTSGIITISRFDDNTANEIISIRGNGTNPELYIVDNGVTVAQIDAGTLTANIKTNLFGSYKLNDCGISQNGLAAVIDNTATIPTASQMRIGSDGTNYLNGHISRIAYFPKRLSNSELQALSAM